MFFFVMMMHDVFYDGFLAVKVFLLYLWRNNSFMKNIVSFFAIVLFFLFSSNLFGQYLYNASGSMVGRMDGNYVYDASGSMLGRFEGNYIYDASGSTLGRI